jgi:hypothetical protein
VAARYRCAHTEPAAAWSSIKDRTGREYYWNKATNEVQWTRPADYVTPTAAALPAWMAHTVGQEYVMPGGVLAREHFFELPLDHTAAAAAAPAPEPAPATPRRLEASAFLKQADAGGADATDGVGVGVGVGGAGVGVGGGGGERVTVFVRELVSAAHAQRTDLPTVMYLQGGPGFPSRRPTAPASGWVASALQDGYRVLLLDQVKDPPLPAAAPSNTRSRRCFCVCVACRRTGAAPARHRSLQRRHSRRPRRRGRRHARGAGGLPRSLPPGQHCARRGGGYLPSFTTRIPFTY